MDSVLLSRYSNFPEPRCETRMPIFLQSLVSAFALQAVLTKEKQEVPISWSEEVRAGLFYPLGLLSFPQQRRITWYRTRKMFHIGTQDP